MENSGRPPVIQFGVFEVDSRAGELRKNGLKIRVQQQPFELLMALLERPGEVVSREELRSRLWPDDTFVDFEHGLNAAVKRLRDVLGESAERPVFIETLAKRGYRFAGSINGGHSAPASLVENSITVSTRLHRLHRVALVVICVVALIAAIEIILLLRLRPKPSNEHLEARLTANSLENPVAGAASSPDGNYLAYSDVTGLYLKSIRSGETHPIVLPKDFLGT